MEKRLILSIDQGTTGTTVLVIDDSLTVVARGYTEFPATYPHKGWMEQDAVQIWDSTLSSIEEALRVGIIDPKNIAVIGITNQRETTVLWDRSSGMPVAPAIVWQCRRTESICKTLRDNGLSSLYHEKTGLLLDPYFSGTKLKWLLDTYDLHPRAKNGDLAFGTVDSWLLFQLTGGTVHATDHTNASRTLLMDISTLSFSDELLEPLGIPRAVLPDLKPSNSHFGVTRDVPFLPDGIPIHGILGDQHAALFGQSAFAPGEAKCTYGTGAFLMLNTGEKLAKSDGGLLSTIAWTIGSEVCYALEGSAFIAGAAVQWFRDGMRIIEKASDIEAFAQKVDDSGGLFFVPALSGLGAPYWRPEARGLFWGITRDTTVEHMARAILEGIALQNHAIFRLMEQESGLNLKVLKVDGGAAANNILMQFQSDILQTIILRPENIETTALGAGAMAALGMGIIPSKDQLKKKGKIARTFYPNMDKETVSLYTNSWEQIVKKA
ncbi:glycerol kinase GlpK [Myxococcota bacterium]|nr:glycerol kinase GlpK [Myxococcota bacterium]MBU1534004.1 glycerol kinase GlpK [Myxococcota bacterium]